MFEVELWNQAADNAVASIHSLSAQRSLARRLANSLQTIAPTQSPTDSWGPWTWSEISAFDSLRLSARLAEHLFPHDLRNELAGRHLLHLCSLKPSDGLGDPDDRILWVASYYKVQRIMPMSIFGPKSPDQETYVGKLLERISYQITGCEQMRRPPVAIRSDQDSDQSFGRQCRRSSLRTH